MRVLVCGSRTFHDRDVVGSVLNGLWWPDLNSTEPRLLTLISGGALGADTLAEQWARSTTGVRFNRYDADWRRHGRGAGPIRNQLMLDDGQPDLVIAFVNKPLERSKGTFDMVRRARQARIPTWVIEVQPVMGA